MTQRPSVRDDLRALEGYHSPQVEVAVRLNTNEAPWPPPGPWIDRVAASVRSIEFNRYPDRSAMALRRAIGASHGVGPEQVFAANGSNEVLQTILLTYAGAGRTVATFEPTYQLHGHIARLTGARTVEGERDARFALDPCEVRRVISAERPHVTFLCSPNNPTGVVDAPEDVQAVLALMDGGLLVVDEAYGQFAAHSALDLVDDETPLAVVRTFSKTWSMAGARLGYCVAPSWLVAELEKVVLPYHLDAVKQLAGLAALDYVAEMEARVRAIVDEREAMSAALADLDVDTWPSGANFVLLRPRRMSGGELWQGLLKRSVLVRDCSGWPRLADCVRVTIGTTQENEAFLDALREVLR